MKTDSRITMRAFVIGVGFSALFSALTVYFSNVKGLYVSSTQIPVLPYALLFLTVLIINPVCRLIRVVRPLATAEILLVFTMGLVSSGVSLYGLSAPLVPIVGGLFNGRWNTSQMEWNRYIEPLVNEQFFVSEPGTRTAAMAYRDSLDRLRDMKAIHDSALEMEKTRELVRAAEAALREAEASTAAEAEKAMEVNHARSALRSACAALQTAATGWEARADGDLMAMPHDKVLEHYKALIGEQEQLVQERQAALSELEGKAFAKVDQFRRGFPRDLRAFPGIFPTVDDNYSAYVYRLQRLWYGKKAIRDLRAAYDASASPDKVKNHIEKAASRLRSADRLKELDVDRARLGNRLEDLRKQILGCEAELNDRYAKGRFAGPDEKRALGRQIDKLDAEKGRLQRAQKKVAAEVEHVNRDVESAKRVDSSIEKLSALAKDLDGPEAVSSASIRQRLSGIMQVFPSFDVSFTRYFAGDIPWAVWAQPLLRWGLLILLTYTVLMTLNVLIFRQWAHHEKLSYPLAQLPEELAGVGTSAEGTLPPVFRSGLFWAGAAISGGVLGWNLLCASQILPGLTPIELNHVWKDFIVNSPLQGLLPRAKSAVFFTMIGVSFLIPKNISFSLWFFAVLYMAQVLILVGLGYGVNEESFPRDWWYTMNFRTAEGGGALMVFSLVVLYKCRKYILCFFNPSSVAELETDERKDLRVSSFLFLFGSLGLILVQWLGMKANLTYAVFFYLVMLLVTIGLIRAVAEGGIIGLQVWANPFHFIRTLFGMDKAWASPSLFASLMVYYAVFFYDLKAFIAPAMANSLKIRDDLKLKRRGFHLSILSAIVIAVVVAVGAELMLSYHRGGDNMNGWFYTAFPNGMFDQIASMQKNPPSVAPAERLWIGAGAAGMAALLYFRQTLFWLPHPIGLIMLVNPLIMSGYWFSIMLGWLAKSLVTKYGNKDTYARIRCLFIGLIFGELLLVILAMICAAAFNVQSGIDLNWPSTSWSR